MDKSLLSSLLLVLVVSHCGRAFDVSEIVARIRESTRQIEDQVQTSRQTVSAHELLAFSAAVELVEQYQEAILPAKEQLFTAAAVENGPYCLETLPKSLAETLATADFNIEVCIGHFFYYGSSITDTTEERMNEFNEIASQLPITSIKDFFLSEWYHEEGVNLFSKALLERMQKWDNILALDLFNLKTNTGKEFQDMMDEAWPKCVNYGIVETGKLFDAAIEYVNDCVAEKKKY